MTPTDVKELLKTLIAEACLPIEVVDIAPTRDLAKYSTTEARIKDVITQWNKDGKIHVLPPGHPGIMEFYTKTDAVSPGKELLEASAIGALLESVIMAEALSVRFNDCGFRLIALSADDMTDYPVKILHGGFRLEKREGATVDLSALEAVVHRFESVLKVKSVKAKIFHRGFQLEKDVSVEMPLSHVKKLAEQIDRTLGLNYVLNAYEYANSDDASETRWTRANICVSLWRFPRR